jgi:acylphosphatase
MTQPSPVACRVVYAGRVQNVGFRATAARIARSHPVSGWVRNLPDGRVELHAEGERPQVAAFLDAVSAYWGDYVTDERRDWRAAEGTHAGFTVRH